MTKTTLTMTLIQRNEIKRHGNASEYISDCTYTELNILEEGQFAACLGRAFYSDLKESLVDYTGTPNFISGTNYIVGDKVRYNGIIWECQQNTNTEPSAGVFWEHAKKFDNDCYNNLWCGYLEAYLSYVVGLSMMRKKAATFSNNGLVNHIGQTFETATKENTLRVEQWYNTMIADTLSLMDYYMRSNNGSGCYNNYKGIAATCCGECGCKRNECICNTCKDSKNITKFGLWIS